jgi:putative DNA primase/helicase
MADKSQPHSIEAEKALLGSILNDPTCLAYIIKEVNSEDFYDKQNGMIYQGMCELSDIRKPIDYLHLQDQVQGINGFDKPDLIYYLTGLSDSCPTSANAVQYAKIIKGKGTLRAKKNAGIRYSRGDEDAIREIDALESKSKLDKKYNESDAGNAELLVDLFGNEIRYNHTNRKWYIWNGQFWEEDISNRIVESAKKAARKRMRTALTITDTTKKIKAVTYALRSEDQNKITACVNSAKTITRISTTANEWDRDDLLLQFNNGTMSLPTVTFSNGNPEWNISQSVGYDYDIDAECTLWEKTIAEIFNSNQALIEYFQRVVGYCLTGSTEEQCFFILYGIGANGKSLVQELLNSLLGHYAEHSQFDAFTRKYNNSSSNDLARLHSARLVIASEGTDRKRFDEERLKQLTGGDSVTARFLFQEHFTFIPKFKIMLAVNSLPKTEDFSDGFWRRVNIIPFEVQFKGENANPDLLHNLRNELPGIMNWALKGLKEWMDQGLNPPIEVINAVEEYRSESDEVARFLNDHVEVVQVVNFEPKLKTSELYGKFIEWHHGEYGKEPSISQSKFSRRVHPVIGIKSEKLGSYRWFIGLKWKENDV